MFSSARPIVKHKYHQHAVAQISQPLWASNPPIRVFAVTETHALQVQRNVSVIAESI